MKKLYLLSAVACLFAMNANAQVDGWWTEGSLNPTLSQVSGTVAKMVVPGDADPWGAQMVPPTWNFKGQDAGAEFEISFEAQFIGASGMITFMHGKNIDGWEAQSGCGQMLVANAQGETNPMTRQGDCTFNPTAEMAAYKFTGVLGDNAGDSIHIEMDFKGAGTYFIQNFTLSYDGVEVAKYFAGGTDAVAAKAAVNAFVANDVLYLSEAANVVIYNVNGVAVKSAKNVNSVNVSDLKAGLYIAKVGNNALKFIK